jgi:AcrR family transcriptional regulator
MSLDTTLPEEAKRDATRRHLIAAAAEVFTESGFQAATVREICERAAANIAAVNYHFGGKEGLYRAVLKETFDTAIKKYPADFGLPPKATAEQRLRAFVYSFLLRIFSEGPSSRYGKLMAREMIEPTGALDDVVSNNMRPMAVVLDSILADLLGKGANETTKRLCACSVVSQVVFYHHCRPVVTRMFPGLKFDAAGLEELATHITGFCLAGIGQKAGKPRKGKRKKR